MVGCTTRGRCPPLARGLWAALTRPGPRAVQVRAVRGGREVELSVRSVVVGDLLLLEAGDILCADGVLVDGYDLR